MLASLTGSFTTFIGDHGVYAVFALMLLSAVLPAASEVVMLYAGAVAAGAFAGAHVVVFGHRFASGGWAYVAMAVADCDECGFNNLGKLLFGGLVLAVIVGILVSVLRRRIRQSGSDSSDFVSIRPSKPNSFH